MLPGRRSGLGCPKGHLAHWIHLSIVTRPTSLNLPSPSGWKIADSPSPYPRNLCPLRRSSSVYGRRLPYFCRLSVVSPTVAEELSCDGYSRWEKPPSPPRKHQRKS